MNLHVPVLFLFLGAMLILALIIGVYVYRDASRRGMNAILWTLVAVVIPSAIGLLIYLLVRGNRTGLHCPSCGMEVAQDWQVCPKCARPLPQSETADDGGRKDRSIWKVLTIVILVPLLLIGVLIAFSFSAVAGAGSASLRDLSLDEYIQAETPDSQAVLTWMENLPNEDNRAHALRFDRQTESGTEYFFLVYAPGTSYGAQGFRQGSSIFGTTLELELHRTGQNGRVLNLISSADRVPQIKVRVNSQEIPCDVTVVNYNPTMFYLEPQENDLEIDTITVSKIVNGERVDRCAIEHEDLIFDLVMCVSNTPYHASDLSIDLSDGYEITVRYKHSGDMLQFQTLTMDGGYWLIEKETDDGGTYLRELNKALYEELTALFLQ